MEDDIANSDDEAPTVELNFFRELAMARPVTKDICEISTDIKDPFSTHGCDGEIYYQGFIESGTKYHYPYFLKI